MVICARAPPAARRDYGRKAAIRALDRKVLRDVVRWRGQILAIVLIVACGVATFVTMLGVLSSLERSRDAFYSQYRFADVFDAATRAPDGAARAIARIPGVAAVQSRIVHDVVLDLPGRPEPATGRMVSVPDAARPALNDLFIKSGRYIEAGARDEAIVSEAFAGANSLAVGSTIRAVINGRLQTLRIVGIAISPEFVYEIRPGDLFPDEAHFGVIWMGERALEGAFAIHDAFNDVAIGLAPGADRDDVIARVDRVLAPYGGIGAYGRDRQTSAQFLTEELSQLRGNAVVVPTIFIAVAAFLLNVLLMRLVGTQREQIATLKSFGYSNAAIVEHYLRFAWVIVALGALLGALLGMWWGSAFIEMYRRFFHFPIFDYRPGAGVFVEAVAVSTLAAAVGAIAAVRSVVRLSPAEAMRPPAPARYGLSAIERSRLAARVPVTTRMVARNVIRKPVVFAVSAFGVAFAVALLMVGSYTGDAVQKMTELQFWQVQREDATVTFNHTLGPAALAELSRYPGVLRVEPFLASAARLSNGNASRRVALFGLPHDAALRAIVDTKGRAYPVPPHGALLNAKLAAVLGVHAGDAVRVELLEGRRTSFDLPVVGLVDEAVGQSVYLDIAALGRLASENARESGAYLELDRAREADLYRRVKATPGIASIAFQASTMQRFRELIGQNLGIFTFFIVAFACIIAFGVVYNVARISLSERVRELSTMRILGFSADEAWRILAGEQLVVAAGAAPLGYLFGLIGAVALSRAYETEYYSFPMLVTPASYVIALLYILATAAISAYLIRRQVTRLDLVAVLKAGD